MSLFFATGSPDTELSDDQIRAGLFEALSKLGNHKRVLAVPPDFTRMHSMSGQITEYSMPTANSSAFGITSGPDGALWFTEQGSNQIGRITV